MIIFSPDMCGAAQEKELEELTCGSAAEGEELGEEEVQRRLRELPPTSDMQMGFEESALGFDTSSLTVQLLQGSPLTAVGKDKSN